MPKAIISDASCFILLDKIGELDLLHKLYTRIVTTPEIVNECGIVLPDWVEVKLAKNIQYQKILELQIDRGEASAIALALESRNSLLILDDYKARKTAQSLGIKITGTIGVIIKAKLNGITPSIAPFLEKIKRTNFRLSDEIIKQAYIEAGEVFNV